jgi:hypothetical protein
MIFNPTLSRLFFDAFYYSILIAIYCKILESNLWLVKKTQPRKTSEAMKLHVINFFIT